MTVHVPSHSSRVTPWSAELSMEERVRMQQSDEQFALRLQAEEERHAHVLRPPGEGGAPAPLGHGGSVAPLPPDTSAFGSAEYSLNRSSSARNDASMSFERSGSGAPLDGDGI